LWTLLHITDIVWIGVPGPLGAIARGSQWW